MERKVGIVQPHGTLSWLQNVLLFPASSTAIEIQLSHATAPLLHNSYVCSKLLKEMPLSKFCISKHCMLANLGGSLPRWGDEEAISCQGKAAFPSCRYTGYFLKKRRVARRVFSKGAEGIGLQKQLAIILLQNYSQKW